MAERAEDKPEYAWLRQFKRAHGAQLRDAYGAHSVGIGWKRTGGRKTDQLALLFYVERKIPAEQLTTAPVPPTIPFNPPDTSEPVLLKTDVIECPPAEFE